LLASAAAAEMRIENSCGKLGIPQSRRQCNYKSWYFR